MDHRRSLLRLTAVWAVGSPRRPGLRPRSGRYRVLRWFHALVWRLLAAIAAAINWAGPAQPPAQLSLVIYLIFLGTLVTMPRAG